jgi:hypothetical protein
VWRWGAGVLAGLILVAVVAWSAGRSSTPEAPEPEPTTEHTTTPDNRVEEPISGAGSPQIIERETVRDVSDDNDSDDDTPVPRVTVVVPQPTTPPSSTQPAPAPTTQPPVIQVPNIPDIPDLPNLGLPLLP